MALTICTVLTVASCASLQGPNEIASWVAFGPFEARSSTKLEVQATSAEPGEPLLRKSEIKLADGTVAKLDAETLLGSGTGLAPIPDRQNYTVTNEQYSYTYDGETPTLVGVVQASHTMHYRGYSDEEFVTFVLGISAEAEPREISRTRVLRGAEHTATITGRSDQGVIAVQLEGELNTNVPYDSRVIGVDAIRATEVWGKDHGYSNYGEDTAVFFLTDRRENCASEVQIYRVANGLAQSTETYPNTDKAAGGTCVTVGSWVSQPGT